MPEPLRLPSIWMLPGFLYEAPGFLERGGFLVGIDAPPAFLERARTLGPTTARWHANDLTQSRFPQGRRNLFYARLLLAHLPRPGNGVFMVISVALASRRPLPERSTSRASTPQPPFARVRRGRRSTSYRAD